MSCLVAGGWLGDGRGRGVVDGGWGEGWESEGGKWRGRGMVGGCRWEGRGMVEVVVGSWISLRRLWLPLVVVLAALGWNVGDVEEGELDI